MRNATFWLTVLTICTGLILPGVPAQAQATRTWVSGVGDDANPCDRTAPCKTFAGAISKTAASGEIDCLDPGGFGALTITKAITIDCSGTFGSVLVSGTNGIVVSAGTFDKVVLRGLDFSGLGTGLSGVLFLAGGSLHIEQSRIRNFNGLSSSFGIAFTPSGASSLYVSDSWVTNNGSGNNGGGILIKPSGSGTARVQLSNVRIQDNGNGIVADGTGTTGSSVTHVRGSVISGSLSTGVLVNTGHSMAVMLDETVVVNNPAGINANGGGSAVFLSNSTVFGSNNGVQENSGGLVLSYKTNNINAGNSPTDGAPNINLSQD